MVQRWAEAAQRLRAGDHAMPDPIDLLMSSARLGGNKPRDPLYSVVADLIYSKWRDHPRSLQVALGPSEIGEPCTRKLAYNLMHHPEVNEGDPLPSVVGTAAHAWMEDACRQWNEKHKRTDWIPESTVTVTNQGAGLKGHSDAYHVPTQYVLDWKFPSPSRIAEYRKNDPLLAYQVQAHCYGIGFKNLGLPVKGVAIVCLPRGGFLKDAYIWSHELDEGMAQTALKRYYDLTELCTALEVDKHPELYQRFPKDAGHHCQYCPWFKPTAEDTGITCRGYADES